MADRPALMSGPSIRAILREIEAPGTGKTQTRRLAWLLSPIEKPVPPYTLRYYHDDRPDEWVRPTIWQSVKPGDRLWVRETWARTCNVNSEDGWPGRPSMPTDPDEPDECVIWAADGGWEWCDDDGFLSEKSYWKPPIHMPRWASRLTLLVTATRMERLQEISEADARAEGIGEPYLGDQDPPFECDAVMVSRRMQFRNLWRRLHTKPGARWEDNPEVCVISFRPVLANIDALEVAG